MESKGRQGGENKNEGRKVGLVGVLFECENVLPWPHFCVQGDGKVGNTKNTPIWACFQC